MSGGPLSGVQTLHCLHRLHWMSLGPKSKEPTNQITLDQDRADSLGLPARIGTARPLAARPSPLESPEAKRMVIQLHGRPAGETDSKMR